MPTLFHINLPRKVVEMRAVDCLDTYLTAYLCRQGDWGSYDDEDKRKLLDKDKSLLLDKDKRVLLVEESWSRLPQHKTGDENLPESERVLTRPIESIDWGEGGTLLLIPDPPKVSDRFIEDYLWGGGLLENRLF